MPTISNPQKLLLALLFLALAALNAGSSSGIRFGGEEEEGSGFGGTGRAPTGGSGLGGTGLRPFLGDAGEVHVHFEPDAVVIAEQVQTDEIKRIPAADEVLPPPAIVTSPEFKAEHTAEVAITDSIQARLKRDAVIYNRILESVEGYYPAEASLDLAPAPAPERTSERPASAGETLDAAPATAGRDDAAAEVTDAAIPAVAAADPTRITWSELAAYLAANGTRVANTDAAVSPEKAENPGAAQRPDRIRRPELPQVQRGRMILRPAVLPPRVQPMQF